MTKIWILAVFAPLIVARPQDEDPARWIAYLSSQRAVDRDEAFIRLLKMGEKAAAALKAAPDPRAKDVLALIEGRQDKLLEILTRAKEEAGASMERLLWRAQHICAALCNDRDWAALKAVLDKGGCAEHGMMRGQHYDSYRYVILSPAWTSKSGSSFDLRMGFEIDPEPSVDGTTLVFVRGVDLSLHLRVSAKIDSLLGAEGFPSDSVLRSATAHPMETGDLKAYSVARWATLDLRQVDASMDWEFRVSLKLDSEDGGKCLYREIEVVTARGEVKTLVVKYDDPREGRQGSQGSVQRLDPPEVEEVSELRQLKPADCAIAYGPGDFQTLPETIRGLVISGEGILQRDFDRIARFRNLTYLELERWKDGRRVRLDVLKQLPDLEGLELHNLFPGDVENVLSLKRLKAIEILDSSRLNEENLIRLAGLPSLIAWDLNDGAAMSDGVFRALAERKGLRHLRWWGRGAPVTDEGLKEVGKLTELRYLSISYAKSLTAEGYEHLAGLQKLRKVILGYSGVDDRVMAVLGKLKSLQEVWIYGADAVTDEGLMHMSSLPDLDYMNVESKTATRKGWEALRAKLPGKWR